jgi:hypothetical protein
VKLVRADKPDHEVQLRIVREGKLESYTVTLEERPRLSAANQPVPAPWWRELPRYVMPAEPPQTKQEEGQSEADSPWKTFDSLTLKKLDDHHYRAEIDYLDKDGHKQHHQFQGTREEIRSQVQAEKDLPVNERKHLLRGLSLRDEPTLPDFWYGPQRGHAFDMMSYPWYDWPDVSLQF